MTDEEITLFLAVRGLRYTPELRHCIAETVIRSFRKTRDVLEVVADLAIGEYERAQAMRLPRDLAARIQDAIEAARIL